MYFAVSKILKHSGKGRVHTTSGLKLYMCKLEKDTWKGMWKGCLNTINAINAIRFQYKTYLDVINLKRFCVEFHPCYLSYVLRNVYFSNSFFFSSQSL